MAEHTKGPWKQAGLTIYTLNERNTNKWDARVQSALRPQCGGASEDECMANARLISSAPDLLEALERLVAEVEDGEEDQGICPLCLHSRTLHAGGCPLVAARAAIAKARGTR